MLIFYKKEGIYTKSGSVHKNLFCLYDLEQASKLLHQSVASRLQVRFVATSFITIRSASTSDSSFIERFFSLCLCLSL